MNLNRLSCCHSRPWRLVLLLAGLWLGGGQALAFNPPVDTAGPLTVRIEGPDEIAQQEAPVPIRVMVENAGDRPLHGTLQIGLIDRWRSDPDGPMKFAVDARGKRAMEFKVIAGRGTYSAHYPIHAVARFELDGKSYEAHPILVLQTKFATLAVAPVALPWKPVEVPKSGALALWSLPVRRSVVLVFGQQPITMPVGWQGSEPRTRGSMHTGTPVLGGEAREVIAMHPPWHEGHVGTIFTEFPIRLPETRPLRLQFANAVRPEGQGDGVTFRVRAAAIDSPEGTLGTIVFDRHTLAKTWQSELIDLSAFAGRTVRLQLESHPGPKNNTGWDESYWAEPTLVIGNPPPPQTFPPADQAASKPLGTLRCGAPEPVQYEVRIWPGQRGLLDTIVGFVRGNQRLTVRGFEVRVLGTSLHDPRSPIFLQSVQEEPSSEGYQVRHHFAGPAGAFDLVGRIWLQQGALRTHFHLDKTPPPEPWRVVHLEEVGLGPWSTKALQVYAGQGNVIRDPEAFRLNFDGHQLATSFVGFDFAGGPSLVMGSDLPPSRLEVRPADRHYSLRVPHEATFSLIPAPDVWTAVKTWRSVNGLKAAGGVGNAAGRFVFDLWGGRCDKTTDELRRAFRYGLTDAMVIWHNWQRWGYDYRLPDIFPPNPQFGTLGELQGLIRTCKQSGVIFALHDNYIDFYPDADGFSYDQRICFNSPGRPQRAWINESRHAQSYRYRSDQLEPFLQRNLRLIRDQLAPTGYFIDVWSSAGPYDYWTTDGRFFTSKFTRDTWGEQFAWIRDFLGGGSPQISESGHDQLIGWLDGAQTNHLRVDKPVPGPLGWCVWNIRCADAERTPWSDAAHHDRFILHGAGYPGRYEGGLDPRLHGITSDDYIATEVLTGHPAMVAQPFSRDVVRKYWLLHHLGRALALRTIQRVEFVGGDLHRQVVRWSGDSASADVWVNRGQSDWTVEGVTLPQYGFLARAHAKDNRMDEASIARRDGLIVETARSTDDLYVNGRAPSGGPLPIRLTVKEFRYLGNRQFSFSLAWKADESIPAGWSPFFHIVDGNGDIAFQASHRPGVFATAQRGEFSSSARGSIPQTVKPGQAFELRFGIYHPGDGQRLALAAGDDGTHRVRLGTIRLEGEGNDLRNARWSPIEPQPDLLLARQNPAGKPIDFGPIITADGCRLTHDSTSLEITPLPQPAGHTFTAKIRWAAVPWHLPEPNFVLRLDDAGKILSREPIRREGEFMIIECPAEAFACRLIHDRKQP